MKEPFLDNLFFDDDMEEFFGYLISTNQEDQLISKDNNHKNEDLDDTESKKGCSKIKKYKRIK